MERRSARQIMKDYDQVCDRDILWEIIEDILDTVEMAIDGVPGFDEYLKRALKDAAMKEIKDYVTNHYGDD